MMCLVAAVSMLLSSGVATAAEPVAPPASSTGTDVSAPVVQEVIVEAAEPRFVAPTRRDRIGRIWAPVLINGRGPFRLVLDTGASSSAVISEVAVSLGLPMRESASVRVHGVTGSAIVSTIAISRLEVGELLMEAASLPIVADVFGGAEGVLGSEGLADKRILIDFSHDRIVIARSHSQRADLGFTRIPLKLTRGRLLTIDLQIGSVHTKAIIDTGAQQTIGNSALRELLKRRALKGAKTQEIIGVTLDVAYGDSLPTPPIAFGGIEIRNLYVTFADMFIFDHWKLTKEPALLVGMDVLGLLDTLIIDYKLRELQVRPRPMMKTSPLLPPG